MIRTDSIARDIIFGAKVESRPRRFASRRATFKSSIDRAKYGGIATLEVRYPGSLVTWRNGSRRDYMGV